MKPDENQQAVIENVCDNIILYAGAGTGKTFTVANKVAYYINNGICEPSEILCLTFTVKACNELLEAIGNLCQTRDVTVKTIHSFCYKILKERSYNLTDAFFSPDICDEVDTETVLQSKILPKLNEISFKDILKNRNAKHSLEWLKEQNVVYLNNKLYFCLKNGQEFFLISYDGRTLKTNDEELLHGKSGLVCPQCKTKQKKQGNYCEVCTYDLREYVPKFEVKVPSLRPFVSFIKRNRAILNFYSDNDIKDYQRVFDYFYKKEKDKIEKLLSYKDSSYNKKILDYNFIDAMTKYCGYFIKKYNDYLENANELDYDDLIVKTYELFNDERYDCPKYKLIVIDEMQDTSELEYSVISKLFSAQVMLCGDINQSIYGWRGAKPNEILTDFTENFSVKEYYLSKNYRSNKNLFDFGNKFLKGALNEKKDSSSVSFSLGDRPVIKKCNNVESEAEYIYSECEKCVGSKAVLVRTNYYAKRLYEKINDIDGKLVFTSVEEEQNLLKSKIVKQFVSFLKIIVNPNDKFTLDKLFIDLIPNVGEATIEKINLPLLGVDSTVFLHKEIYDGEDVYGELITAYENKNVTVFDIETGSLDVDETELLQLSAKRGDGKTFNRFIKNKKPLNEEVVKVHGITEEYLAEHGEELSVVLKDFSEFVKDSVLVGHNSNNFDVKVLERLFAEENICFSYLNHYDTLILIKKILKDVKNYKLSTLCDRLSIINLKAHDAFYDVEATEKVLEYIIKNIKQTRLPRGIIINKNIDKFIDFATFYVLLKSLNTTEFINKLSEYLLLKNSVDEVSYLADLNKLKRFCRKIDKSLPLFEAINKFLKESSENDYYKETIPILTVHQAKGMEFDNVFIAGLDDVTFPDDGANGEQRRVFYVAITRAKKKLFITFCDKNYFGGKVLPSELLRFV